MGIDDESLFQGCVLITSLLAAPHWWSWGAVGVPSRGLEIRAALAQSHTCTPLLILHGQQKQSWNTSHTKRRQTPPSCHPNRCSHLDTSALKRLKVTLNFKNNQGLMEVTAGGLLFISTGENASGVHSEPSELRFGVAFPGCDGRDVGSAAEAEVVRG